MEKGSAHDEHLLPSKKAEVVGLRLDHYHGQECMMARTDWYA